MRFLIFIFFIAGCASISDFLLPQPIDKDPNVEWRKDLVLDVNGKRYKGMALVPTQSKYEIKIYPADKRIDRLQWRTCHRNDSVDKAVESGFWPWSKKKEYFTMIFEPKSIELERACPLRIEALAQKHKSMAFGMVIFPDSRQHYNLEAVLECNGRTQIRVGTSECQGAIMSLHKVIFGGEVVQDDRPNEQCPPMKQVQENVFEFFMPKNECVYLFKSFEKVDGKYRTHKIITYGYEKIPPPQGV